VSNEAGSEFAECCWWAANALVFYSDSIARVAINPPDQHQYNRLNQYISLISYQYLSSALPA
jgi:hypothetical protein